jgi:hypothetical protein
MASGYYPLSKDEEGGKQLQEIADKLRNLINTAGYHGVLPSASDNDQYDNAASDGRYEAYLSIALNMIERCVTK